MKYITFTVLYQDEILLIIKILNNEVKFIIMIVKLALVVKYRVPVHMRMRSTREPRARINIIYGNYCVLTRQKRAKGLGL